MGVLMLFIQKNCCFKTNFLGGFCFSSFVLYVCLYLGARQKHLWHARFVWGLTRFKVSNMVWLPRAKIQKQHVLHMQLPSIYLPYFNLLNFKVPTTFLCVQPLYLCEKLWTSSVLILNWFDVGRVLGRIWV